MNIPNAGKISKAEVVRRADTMLTEMQERNERQKESLTRLGAQQASVVEVCRHNVRLGKSDQARAKNIDGYILRAKFELATEILGVLGAAQ